MILFDASIILALTLTVCIGVLVVFNSTNVLADTATLIPGAGTTTAGGDGTDSANITDGTTACTSVVCANEIDETIASTDDDTTYNTNDQAEITGTQFYQLTDMATGYTSMNTVTLDVR